MRATIRKYTHALDNAPPYLFCTLAAHRHRFFGLFLRHRRRRRFDADEDASNVGRGDAPLTSVVPFWLELGAYLGSSMHEKNLGEEKTFILIFFPLSFFWPKCGRGKKMEDKIPLSLFCSLS